MTHQKNSFTFFHMYQVMHCMHCNTFNRCSSMGISLSVSYFLRCNLLFADQCGQLHQYQLFQACMDLQWIDKSLRGVLEAAVSPKLNYMHIFQPQRGAITN